MCPHGGQANVITTNTRVKGGTRFLLRVTDTFIIAGCPFVIGTVPSPCITVRWLNESKKVKVTGAPVLLESSVGLCQSAAGVPQGILMKMGVQSNAKAL